jgi:hypothetical protein
MNEVSFHFLTETSASYRFLGQFEALRFRFRAAEPHQGDAHRCSDSNIACIPDGAFVSTEDLPRPLDGGAPQHIKGFAPLEKDLMSLSIRNILNLELSAIHLTCQNFMEMTI